MVSIDKRGRKLSEREIITIETRLGAHLPEMYRQFLWEYNGGVPTPDVIDVDGMPGSPTDVQVFFGIDRLIKSSNIDWNLATFAERIDRRLLPIACDSGNNLFCISLHGGDRGRVLYCDFTGGDAVTYLVAMDFGLFLESLRTFEDGGLPHL